MLPEVVSEAQTRPCGMSHLQSILPKYYQSGDLIYGASILRAFFDSGQHKFTKLPPGILPTKTSVCEHYSMISLLVK